MIGRAALTVAALALLVAVRRPRKRVARVMRVSRLVTDLDRAEAFYRDTLGFRTLRRGPSDPVMLGLRGGVAEEAVMRLGADEIALVRLHPPGRPYPPGSRSDDLWFQHLAIVVADMDAAHACVAQAQAEAGAQAISVGGPQTLPPANGGVRAWKFRDPDGHPLELLWFPPGAGRAVWRRHAAGAVFLGIDHSALAVSSGARSVRFYRRLGFTVAARSRNTGPAQSRLDGLPGAQLRVISLRPASAGGSGLELLAYRPPGRSAARVRTGDTAADWTTIAMGGRPAAGLRRVRDPDGHRLLLTG